MPEPRVVTDAEGLRSGFNETGSPIPKETFVKLNTAGTEPESVEPATAGDRVYGVTTDLIADGDRGGVQVRGRARVLAGAATGDGVAVASDANGKAVLGVSTNVVAGQSITAAAALDDVMEVELAGPGGGAIVP